MVLRLELQGDVIDTRTGKYHSVVKVKQRLAKYFVPATEQEVIPDA